MNSLTTQQEKVKERLSEKISWVAAPSGVSPIYWGVCQYVKNEKEVGRVALVDLFEWDSLYELLSEDYLKAEDEERFYSWCLYQSLSRLVNGDSARWAQGFRPLAAEVVSEYPRALTGQKFEHHLTLLKDQAEALFVEDYLRDTRIGIRSRASLLDFYFIEKVAFFSQFVEELTSGGPRAGVALALFIEATCRLRHAFVDLQRFRKKEEFVLLVDLPPSAF